MKWIVKKWDNFVYSIAWASIWRIFESDRGLAYLFELWIRDWNESHPVSDELKSATEWFFETQKAARSVPTGTDPTSSQPPFFPSGESSASASSQ